MQKPKRLMTTYAMRRAGIALLRAKLAELQEMSDAGDGREEVYATFVGITNEIERRKLKAQRSHFLIPRGVAKVMKIGDVRAKYEELLHTRQPTVDQVKTMHMLTDEMLRRRAHHRDTYQRRKAVAQAVMEAVA